MSHLINTKYVNTLGNTHTYLGTTLQTRLNRMKVIEAN